MKRAVIVIGIAAAFAGCSEGSRATSGVPKSVAETWSAKWCQAQPGSTKEALVAIMGPPTGASPEHMSWSAHQFQFNAFLDPAGTVRQLDINRHSLSEAEKAALRCDPVRTRESVAPAAEAVSPARPSPKACTLVTNAEMSAILGAAVVGESNERSTGRTVCTYNPASGISPYVELAVDWGGGPAAMAAAGTMGRIEPGISNPYQGLGDQAAAIGPMLMIRTGEDLVQITFTGVSEVPAKARKIFDTAKAKM